MTDQPASTAQAAAHPRVKGCCPACGWLTLYLGSGGHVTCSRLDCPNPCAADDQLHRGQPDGSLPDRLRTLVESEVYEYRERTMFWPETGGITEEIARLATRGALEAIDAHLEFGSEDAWCKTCRRVWNGKGHQCETDAEQRLTKIRDLRTDLRGITGARWIADALDTILDTSAEQPAQTTPNNPCPACQRADQAGLSPDEQHPHCHTPATSKETP